jgi:hypothetical protein
MAGIPINKVMERLQTGRTEIFFRKTNGNIRHMVCTLNPTLAPEILLAKGESKNQEIVPVWDLEKDDWRSFRADSVLYLGDEEKKLT